MTADFPQLTTNRLVLRQFRDSDAGDVFMIFTDPRVTRFHNVETMTSLGQANELVDRRISLYPNNWGVRWAITLLSGPDQVIGSCGFNLPLRDFRLAEVGFELYPQYWRQGLMSEALRAVIDYAYSDRYIIEINRIQAMTSLNNLASINLLQKFGFQQEGVLREYGYWDGRFHDLRIFSLLRREWLGGDSAKGN
jgi:ribosomal-protein-alanine N-acetyltransferase